MNREHTLADTVNKLLEPTAGEHKIKGFPALEDVDPEIVKLGKRLWLNAENAAENYLAMRCFIDIMPEIGESHTSPHKELLQ